jgi:NADH-quinone oxidoreductase subunit N
MLIYELFKNYEMLFFDDIIKESIMSLNEVSTIFPEIFFVLSILFLILHGVLLCSNKSKNYPLIQNSILNLGILILIFTFILVCNNLILLKYSFFNSTIIMDNLTISSKQCILIASIICLLAIQEYLNDQKINSFEYILLILFAIFGLILLCSSNDLITAYLAIEVQSLSFYLLAAYKKNSIFSTESGLKYFVLGAFSSSMFLLGSSLIYGTTGSTNFEDCKDLFFYVYPGSSLIEESNEFTQIFNLNLLQFGFLFLSISLFFKLALAPFHIWSPDIYEGSLTSSTIFFTIIPKLSLFILLVRFFQCSFYGFIDNWRYCFVIIAVLSIIVGSFAGLEQRKVKSLLAYSSISHMGYSLLAFSTGTLEGIQVLFCYLLIYILSGLCIWSIFLTLRLKNNYLYKGNKDLSDFVLLVKSNSVVAICFSTVLLSLAGFPPLIGFYVKLNIFLSAIESTMYFSATISIICSVISTFYYIRIIKVLYFEKGLIGNLYYPIKYKNALVIGFCFFLFIILFLNPNILYFYCYKMCLIECPL